MQTHSRFLFLTLSLMISFASVNAVLFTPALPVIAKFFAVSESAAQLTITWFLIGYAIGQLLYGPVANRFGRKPALYAGIILQILSSLLCAAAGYMHLYSILVIGRFLLALGSGVGLKMAFTLVNEIYEPVIASQKTSYIMIAFAVMPGLSITLGGLLSTHFGWISTFYASAIYGVILLLLTTQLQETKKHLDMDALKWKHLIQGYLSQFKNFQLIRGSLLMGSGTAFVYVFAALAPFIAINIMHMTVTTYGITNLLPPIGLILGSFASVKLVKKYKTVFIIRSGIITSLVATVLMFLFLLLKMPVMLTLFVPMTICYFGLSLVLSNAATVAIGNVLDKAHGSAVMNFINMGLSTFIVLTISAFPINTFLLPAIYVGLCIFMAVLNNYETKYCERKCLS